MGPNKDVVAFGGCGAEAGNCASESASIMVSYKWWAVSHLADKTGPLAGVPYDGADPKFAGSLSRRRLRKIRRQARLERRRHPDSWKRHYLDRMTGPDRQISADFLYSDGCFPLRIMG